MKKKRKFKLTITESIYTNTKIYKLWPKTAILESTVGLASHLPLNNNTINHNITPWIYVRWPPWAGVMGIYRHEKFDLSCQEWLATSAQMSGHLGRDSCIIFIDRQVWNVQFMRHDQNFRLQWGHFFYAQDPSPPQHDRQHWAFE